MKNKNINKKKISSQNGTNKGKKRFSIDHDPFFDAGSKRRRNLEDDENIESSDGESEEFDDEFSGGEAAEEVAEFEEETPAEKRKRLADAYVEKLRATAKRQQKEKEEEGEEESGDERAKEGERDNIVGNLLLQEQLEASGRVQRLIASRYFLPTLSPFLGLGSIYLEQKSNDTLHQFID